MDAAPEPLTQRVQLAGLAQPGECWAAVAADFLKTTLAGKASAQDAAKAAGLGLWGAPCAGADTVAPPPPPPPAPQPTYDPPPPQPVQPAPPADAYYANCDAVRAAGKAPLYAGRPGYRAALDRDKDGVACE